MAERPTLETCMECGGKLSSEVEVDKIITKRQFANIPVALRGRSPEGVPDCGQEQRRPRVRSTDQTLGRRACPLDTTGQRPAGTMTGLLGA